LYTPGGYYTEDMKNKKVINRIKRLSGQLESLVKRIEVGEDCQQTINQFLAVKGGLNSAFNQYVSEAITECAHKDKPQLEKLIQTLIKN